MNRTLTTLLALTPILHLGFGCASDTPSSTCPAPKGMEISNFEDGGNGVAQVEGRNGGWYVYNDGTGKQEPAVGKVSPAENGACESAFALRTTGMDFTDWGAGIGTDLATDKSNKKTAYDGSRYKGVRFYARSNTGPIAVRVKIQDANTTPEGGICNDAMKLCNDTFGKDVMITADWLPYDVAFADTAQEGWGDKFAAVDTNRLFGIQIQTRTSPFDFAVDEMSFY
jgi:hypothetical protein